MGEDVPAALVTVSPVTTRSARTGLSSTAPSMSRRRGVWTARCPPDVSRRSTPERLYTAHRAATINRLIGEGELPDPCRGEGGRLGGWNGLRRPTAGTERYYAVFRLDHLGVWRSW